MKRWQLVWAGLALAACGQDAKESDGEATDAARAADATSDAAAPEADAAGGAASVPDAGPRAGAAPDAWVAPDATPVTGPDATPDAAPEAAPDAAPEAVLAPQNAWGPTGRIDRLDVPADPAAARAAGCALFGANVGTGLHNLVLLAGGIERYVRPNARGQVPVVILLRAGGWPAGAPASALRGVDLDFLRGAQDAEARFFIDPASFPDGDPGQPPISSFPETAVESGGWLDPPPGRFVLPVPVPGGYVFQLTMSEARIAGRLFPDGPGFGVADGLITGYVADATLLTAIADVRALCATPEAPGVCALLDGVLGDNDDAAVRDLLVGQAGGFDVHLDEAGHPHPCDPAQGPVCNAVSACLEFSAVGVVVEGLAPPP